MTPSRRRALLALGGAGLHCVVRAALAQSAVQGMRTARGEVMVNGRPGAPGTPVRAGDTIEIGKNALATFVVGRDAFLMRSDSRAELSGSGAAVVGSRGTAERAAVAVGAVTGRPWSHRVSTEDRG